MTIDRSKFPKSKSSGSLELVAKIGAEIAQAALTTIGLGLPKGASAIPGVVSLANTIKSHLAESKEINEKSEKLGVSSEEYKNALANKELEEQIKEVQDLQKKLGMHFVIADKFTEGIKESSKNVKEGFEEVAKSISEQPKIQVEELKKAGFGQGKEGGIGKALFGGLKVPEARQEAIQLALGGLGLGGVEEVFGISGRVENIISQTKESLAKSKEEATTAKKLGISPEEYREAQKASDIKKERRSLYEEATSLGIKPSADFSDIAAEIEAEKASKAASKVAGQPGVALTEDTLAEFVAGIKDGVTEGLKEAGIVLENQAEDISAIVDNTEKTHEEISNLHQTMKENEIQPVVEKLEKQEVSLKKIAANTEKVKDELHEDKGDEEKKEKGLINSIISSFVSKALSPTGILTMAALGSATFALARIFGAREREKEAVEAEGGTEKEIHGVIDRRNKIMSDALRKQELSEDEIKKSLTPGSELHLDVRPGDIPTKENLRKREKDASAAVEVMRKSTQEAEGVKVEPIPSMRMPEFKEKATGEQKGGTTVNNYVQSPASPPIISRNPNNNDLRNLHFIP